MMQGLVIGYACLGIKIVSAASRLPWGADLLQSLFAPTVLKGSNVKVLLCGCGPKKVLRYYDDHLIVQRMHMK